MSSESKINIHHSSLVGLKAELLRKQAEVGLAKTKIKNAPPIDKSKSSIKKNCEQKKESRNKEKKSDKIDVENAHILEKSKLMLEAKSRLYDKLTKMHTNMSTDFLVDFKHKPDEPEDKVDQNNVKDASDADDDDSDSEWVEYTDCFGRTRKCLREALPKIKQEDDNLKQKIVNKPPEEKLLEKPLYFEDRIPDKEPEIEILRRKWEEQTAKLADKKNIHYQDVLFDEARTHGVSYYAFSQDEEERKKQQENLLKLRKETKQKQQENQAIRDMKNKIQQNRLKAAKLRQRIRAGLPIEEETKETVSTERNQNTISIQSKEEINKISNIEKNNRQETAKRKLVEIESKIDTFGESLGKEREWRVMSQEEWVHKKRKERNTEFGPIYENFKYGGSYSSNSSMIKVSNDLLNNHIDTVGPMPMEKHVHKIIEPIPPVEEESNIIEPIPSNYNHFAESIPVNNKDAVVNIAEQIEAGLKYLRNQFESQKNMS